ncbi:MAG: SRPBCC family protein [Silvibacterium sp.]|nr:SRPBCC family protein [Silvibacterium sp.]
MTGSAWQTEQSVDTAASPDFAWAYMSNVANWDDPPAQFVLEGPFADGSRGTTHMPGQPPQHWRLRDVVPVKSYTIEFSLDGAIMYFKWRFAALGEGRTRLTQQIVLDGENAATYLPLVQQSFAVSLKPGMERIAASIDAAHIARE